MARPPVDVGASTLAPTIVPLSIRGEARSLIRRSSLINTGNSGLCYVIVTKTCLLQLQSLFHKDKAYGHKVTDSNVRSRAVSTVCFVSYKVQNVCIGIL